MIINRGFFRLSRRSAFLIIHGILFIMIGYSYFGPVSPPARKALRLALEVAPIWAYGLGWISSGVIAIIGGFVRRLDWLGFAVAVLMPSLWSIVYLTAWRAGDSSRGWVTAVLFLLISSAILIVAGMPDTTELKKIVDPEGSQQ